MSEDEEKKTAEEEAPKKPAAEKKAPKPKTAPKGDEAIVETEKPKPRPPAKKKKVEKPEAEEKTEEPGEKKAPKPRPPVKKKIVVEEEPEEEAGEEEVSEEEEPEEGEEEEAETIEIVEEVKTYKVKIKPELNADLKRKLVVRKGIKDKTPTFMRQEWFRYKRLGTAWRKPRGLQSKARRHKSYRTNVVSVGYGSPAGARGLHPSGFQEVMVYNTADLETIDPKLQAARIGHGVGTRKRVAIEKEAEEKGIRILNPRR